MHRNNLFLFYMHARIILQALIRPQVNGKVLPVPLKNAVILHFLIAHIKGSHLETWIVMLLLLENLLNLDWTCSLHKAIQKTLDCIVNVPDVLQSSLSRLKSLKMFEVNYLN